MNEQAPNISQDVAGQVNELAWYNNPNATYEELPTYELVGRLTEAEVNGDKTMAYEGPEGQSPLVEEVAKRLSSEDTGIMELAKILAEGELKEAGLTQKLANQAINKRLVDYHNKNLGKHTMSEGQIATDNLRNRIMTYKDKQKEQLAATGAFPDRRATKPKTEGELLDEIQDIHDQDDSGKRVAQEGKELLSDSVGERNILDKFADEIDYSLFNDPTKRAESVASLVMLGYGPRTAAVIRELISGESGLGVKVNNAEGLRKYAKLERQRGRSLNKHLDELYNNDSQDKQIATKTKKLPTKVTDRLEAARTKRLERHKTRSNKNKQAAGNREDAPTEELVRLNDQIDEEEKKKSKKGHSALAEYARKSATWIRTRNSANNKKPTEQEQKNSNS